MERANLQNANLGLAILEGADFRQANLSNANFKQVSISELNKSDGAKYNEQIKFSENFDPVENQMIFVPSLQ